MALKLEIFMTSAKNHLLWSLSKHSLCSIKIQAEKKRVKTSSYASRALKVMDFFIMKWRAQILHKKAQKGVFMNDLNCMALAAFMFINEYVGHFIN